MFTEIAHLPKLSKFLDLSETGLCPAPKGSVSFSECQNLDFKGPVITIGMLELMWVFTTVERVNFAPNWLRTILLVYDF